MKEIFLDFLEVSASMAIVIAVIALFSSLIDKKFSSKWKYWVWLFIALRLLVPISPDFEIAEQKMELSVPDKVVYFFLHFQFRLISFLRDYHEKS